MPTLKRKYGRLQVVGSPQGKKVAVRCVCGVRTVIYVHNLTSGRTLSCGCLTRDKKIKLQEERGLAYQSWRDMQYRCYRTRNKEYPRYGGRGIQVHADWLGKDGFQRFLAHVGQRPSRGHTLERLDNDGDYAPDNVCWATRYQQARNTSKVIKVIYRGRQQVLRDLCQCRGVAFSLVYQRIHKWHWPLEKALTTPSRRA